MILTQHDQQVVQHIRSNTIKRHDTRLSIEERAAAVGVHPQTIKSRIKAIKRKNPAISDEDATEKALKQGKSERCGRRS
ncbi:hypothetical protein [uncultured Kushneria sp.]|uniref:hypothetical protein n=1 Tax=uncultured Kushneria sp. TaxID=905033 RepID=UPI002620307D|nr:hypothetical protein [uncultured Kushneria sp.]